MVQYNPNMNRIVTVIGGSGFVGRYVVRALAKRGYRMRVAVRRPDLAGHLQPLGYLGQILAMQANVRHRPSVERAVRGSHAVVNLVGILYERGRQRFDAVHAEAARVVADCARQAGVERLAHMSAIGADANSPSDYARSKALGEQGVLASFPEATIVRPSIVFGPEDQFFNRFAAMARISPVLPIVGGSTRFQPAFVGDVAEAFARIVDGQARGAIAYELGGPDVKTFRELLEFMLEVVGRKRWIVELPRSIANLQASILERLPGEPLLTRDQVRQLARDNIVSEEAVRDGRTFQGLGITPDSIHVVVPTYLARFRRSGQFTQRRPTRVGGNEVGYIGRIGSSGGEPTGGP
jgi:uncharacterized protein YbjT (DUF2867 family)